MRIYHFYFIIDMIFILEILLHLLVQLSKYWLKLYRGKLFCIIILLYRPLKLVISKVYGYVGFLWVGYSTLLITKTRPT